MNSKRMFIISKSSMYSIRRCRMIAKTVSMVLAALLLVSLVNAQVPLRIPRISQMAKVSQTIGLSEVSITYHRPGVKGREIWGNVVKYDEVWRAGANEPTLVTFSDEVTIAGKKLGAGTYRFVVIPSKTGDWTLIFNSETRNWGTVYDAKYDSLKIMVRPETGSNEEWMSFSFTDLTPSSARVVLAWEKIRLSFRVEFNILSKLQASVGNWQTLNGAARFALDNKMYPEEGLAWAERSIALDRNARNLQTKAELLAQAGKVSDAIATAEEAVKIAKAKDPKANTGGLEKLISDWKTK
ncbi:MAG: DUF2911 domain-containing protein [Ignavibacteriae bacterium]|nr:MAG: DUF2911 domain-containing protein [Ignavibacteriota bacterium]